MTQGTKIGLLVSLAFLIVVFVLLSDHVANATDARPAPVTVAGADVSRGTTTPGAGTIASPETLKPQAAVAPSGPVATAAEMAPKPVPAVASVVVGPLPTGTTEISAANANVLTNRHAEMPVGVGPGTSVITFDTARPADATLPVELVRADTPGIAPVQPVLTAQLPQLPRSTQRVAKAGDTVSKMARDAYGSDSRSNRELIINANKSLKANPNKIEVGVTYTIPAKPGMVAIAPTTRPAAASNTLLTPAPAAVSTTNPEPSRAAAAPAAERTYTVKSGDNLWKIAKEVCGDPNAVDQIKKLNRDVLKNGTDLKVGAKLRLPPAKTPATENRGGASRGSSAVV